MAILAFAAAGAALAPAGYAGIGWTIGAVVGQALFPGRLPEVTGPRIADLKAPPSNYGAPIPRMYGTVRTAGIIVWSTDRLETVTRTRQGGKGGPSQTTTTFSYRMSFAVKFGKGPAIGVRKIWANGRLIYNVAANADIATVAASNILTPGLAFYRGVETDDSDPTMEAYLGVGNAPAFRDDIGLVLTDFQLADYGNNPPVITAEIVMEGAEEDQVIFGSTPATAAYSGIATDGSIFVAAARSGPGGVTRSVDGINWSPIIEFLPAVTNIASIGYGGGLWVCGTTSAICYTSEDSINWTSRVIPYSFGFDRVKHNGTLWVALGGGDVSLRSLDGKVWTQHTLPVSATWVDLAWDGIRWVALASNGTLAFSADGTVWVAGAIGFGSNWNRIATNGTRLVAVKTNIADSGYSDDGGATWSSATLESRGWAALTFEGGQFIAIGTAQRIAVGDGASWSVSAFPGSSGFAFRDIASAGGLNVAGPVLGSGGASAMFRLDVIEPNAVPLQDVIADICESAGLDPSDYDVSALTDTVDGYAIARQMSARQAIEPLLQGYYVDAAESNGQIRFVPRGGAVALTVEPGDLGAHVAGDQPPDPIELVRQQEVELPAVVNVGYINREADYEQSVQRAVRTTVQSQLQRDVELSLVFTDDKARGVAEVLIGDAWTQRTRFAVQLPANYAVLQPTDVIDVPGESVTHRMRIERIVESRARVLRIEGPAEEVSVYAQSVTGGAGLVAPGTVRAAPLTQLQLLDIPVLRDQDDGLNIYAAAAGVSVGWQGAVLYRSADSGASYDDIGAIVTESPIGYATSVLAAGVTGGFVFDQTNTVNVVMLTGELAGASEDALGGGANYLLIGNEIVQFRTATLIATNTYRLSNLLRGRRGTEWAMSGHANGERVVLLTPTGLQRFDAVLAAARLYKPVSIGRTVQETPERAFTYDGVNLTPFAPAHLRGWRNAASDLIVAFDRRSRTGVGLPLFIDPPLGETNQRYDVEIWNSAFSVLRRTYSAITTPTVTYTLAQQTSDSGGVQAAYGIRAFQLSTTAGRGYALQGVL